MFLPLSMFSLNISFVSSSCFTKNVVVDGNVWQFKLGDCSLITNGILLSLVFKLWLEIEKSKFSGEEKLCSCLEVDVVLIDETW